MELPDSPYIDGKARGLLAKSWNVGADGKEWRFQLRMDLKFDDGSAITPEIVLLNFKRMLWLTRSEGLVLNSLLPEIKTWQSMDEQTRVVVIENANELVFRFNRRPLCLFEAIGQPIYGIAHPKCFDHNGKWKEPMCSVASGQYKVTNVSDSSIDIMSRNVFESVSDAPRKVSIHWPLANDSVIGALEQSRADLTVEHSFALGSKKLNELKARGVNVISEPPLRMHFVHLNHHRAPFQDKHLRQAFRDIFYDRIAKDTDFLSSGIQPDQSFISKGGIGYKHFHFNLAKNVKPSNSKSELQVLFYPLSSDQRIQDSIEHAIIHTLAKLDLSFRIVRYPERFEAFNRMRNYDFDLIVRGTGILAHNPYGDLRMMFLSALGAKIPDPSNNIPTLIEEAEIESDSMKRESIVTRINEIVFDESAIITFAHSNLIYLFSKSLDFSRYNLYADPIDFRAIGWDK